MQSSATHVKVTKWIHGSRCVLSTDVDAIRLADDPAELFLEPAVVRFLDRMQALADAGDIDELERHGTVYVRRSA
jgi:hypothetical protein